MTFDVYTAMLLKQRLCRLLPVGHAFAQYKTILQVSPYDVLVHKRAGFLAEGQPSEYASFREIEPSGVEFEIEPPQHLGPGSLLPIKSKTRAFYVASLDNAELRARSSVIVVGDTAFLDMESPEADMIDDQFELDPAIFARDTEGGVLYIENGRDVVEFEEAFVSLVGLHAPAFGHWLWEYLPKLLSAISADALPAMRVLVDADQPKAHFDALRMVLPPGFEMTPVPAGATIRLERAWCAPSLMYMPLLEITNDRWHRNYPRYLATLPQRFDGVLTMLRGASTASRAETALRRRVYLARGDRLHRKLVNSEEIEAIARRREFEVVYPEQREFSEQVQLIREARFIVGPEGSAFSLCAFAEPGTKVCILNHTHAEGLVALSGIWCQAGLDVTIVTGRIVRANDEPGYPNFGGTHFADYEIDPVLFTDFLETWLC